MPISREWSEKQRCFFISLLTMNVGLMTAFGRISAKL